MTVQLLIDTIPLDFKEVTIQESKDGVPGKFVAKGEFAVCDKPTANGRVYTRSLWEKQINRLNEKVSSRKVLGELDHPCLTSNDFRVLTVNGWKNFSDVKKGDKVWSRLNGKAVLSVVEDIIDQPYKGKAFNFKGKNINSTFTPAHKMLTVKRPDSNSKNEEYLLASELASNLGKYAHSAIPKTANWFSETIDKFVVPGVDVKRLNSCKNDVSKPLFVDSKIFAAFMGIYLSEGNYSSDSTDTYAVFVSQKKEWSKNFIYDEILSKFPKEIEWVYHKSSNSFYTADARLYFYLKKLGNRYNKYIPNEIKSLGSDCLRELVFWFSIGDERIVSSDNKAKNISKDKTFKESVVDNIRKHDIIKYTRQDVFSVSEKLIRDLHECVVKYGGSCSFSKIKQVGDRRIEDRIIKEENRKPLYQLHISNSKNIWLDSRFLEVNEVEHEGNIYCLTTTYGNFYIEQNGNSFWTGNSDGKTKLTRVSHLITGLKVENGKVFGEAEIIDTPNGNILKSLKKANVQIGVSSRGFGSTKPPIDGISEVNEDDYILDTFDFVYEPADQGAYPQFVTEERQKIPADDILTVDDLRENYSGLLSVIEEDAARDAQKIVEERLITDFSKQLRESVEDARNSAYERALSDVQDLPEYGGAFNLLETISSMIHSFGINNDGQAIIAEKQKELESLQAKIAEQEEQIKSASDEIVKVRSLAKKAAYTLHLERKTSELSSSDTIRKLIGDVEQYESIKEMDEKLEALLKEFPNETIEETDVDEIQNELDETKEKLGKVEENLNKSNSQLRKAIEIAERYETIVMMERKIANHPRANEIRSFVEERESITESTVLRAIEDHPVHTPDNDEIDKIRAAVSRGKQRSMNFDTFGSMSDTPENGNVGSPLLEEFGLSVDQFNELASVNKAEH